MDDQIAVSIIICTRDRVTDLVGTLEAVGRTCVPDDMPCELLIVDNGSTDGTALLAQVVRLPNMTVHYIHEPRRGQCHARNAGLAAAQGQVILFTDDDVRPSHDWIAGMAGPILRGETDAVAGGVRFAPHLDRPWLTDIQRGNMADTATLEQFESDCPSRLVGANMAFAKAVTVKVPAFDTELGPGALGFGDETLFTHQLHQAGYRVRGAFHNVMEHHFDPDRLTKAVMVDAAKKHGRSKAYVAHHWRHEELRAVRLRMLVRLVRLLLARWRKRHDLEQSEGLSAWEADHIEHIALFQQTLQERGRPRNYEKYGLVKLTHE